MTSFDKTFCASPNCVGDCGRKMSESLRMRLDSQKVKPISYGYFCGEPECPEIRDINIIDACPTCGEHHDK